MAYEPIKQEIIQLQRVAYKSKMGKHITDNILIPILQKLDPILDDMLDWIGFLLQDEVQFLLSTASPGATYDVYYVDKSMPWGQRSVKIGEYTASERGGPPFSPKGGGETDWPQSGTLYKSIFYKVSGNTVTVGIENNDPPYRVWLKWGKLHIFAQDDWSSPKKGASQYGSILDDPLYEFHRPFFRSALASIKPEIKRRFREEFKKALAEVTKRPTVRRAIEIRFIWRSQ